MKTEETTLAVEQREARVGMITGSRIAAVSGIYPWKGPGEVFDEIMEEIRLGKPLFDEEEDNEHMERGRFLENAIRDWTSHRIDHPIERCGTILRPDIAPWFAVSPDGKVLDGDDVFASFEAKSPGGFTRIGEGLEDWQDPTDVPDGIPSYHFPQVTWEMLGVGVEEAFVSALIGGFLKVYRIGLDPDLTSALLDTANEFFEKHIKTGNPPPVDRSESSARWIKKRLAKHDPTRDFVQVGKDDPIFAEVLNLHQITEGLKELQAAKTGAENMIKEAIGDAPGLVGPGVKIHWKKQSDSTTVDKNAILAYCEETGIDSSQFFKPKKGARVFRPYFKK